MDDTTSNPEQDSITLGGVTYPEPTTFMLMKKATLMLISIADSLVKLTKQAEDINHGIHALHNDMKRNK